jgi:hypothetical protein
VYRHIDHTQQANNIFTALLYTSTTFPIQLQNPIHPLSSTIRGTALTLTQTDDATPLMYCTVLDPELDTDALGLPTSPGSKFGWNIVTNLTLPYQLSAARQHQLLCEWDWLYLMEYEGTGGRHGRKAKIEAIDDDERTCAGLAEISKNQPKQEYAIWWEMCHDKPDAKARLKEQIEQNKEAKKKTGGKKSNKQTSV